MEEGNIGRGMAYGSVIGSAVWAAVILAVFAVV